MSPANRNLSSENTLDGTATTAILPVDVPNTPHRWARGVRAGRWLFATGLSGTDYVHALAPEVLQRGHPFDGPSRRIVKPNGCFETWPRFFPQGEQLRATSFASISIIRPQAWSTPTIERDESFSKARSRLRPLTFIGALRARSSRWRYKSWPRSPVGISKSGMRRAPRLTDLRQLGIQSGAERGRLSLRSRSDRRGFARRGCTDRSGGSSCPWFVERHADQTRNGFHHQKKTQADVGGSERGVRDCRQGTGLSARSRGHSGIS